jgi:hypothetical protein
MAGASSPAVVKVDDVGRVRATAWVPMAEGDLRTRLADAAWPMQFDKTGTALVGRAGGRIVRAPRLPHVRFPLRGMDGPTVSDADGVRSHARAIELLLEVREPVDSFPEGQGVRLEYVIDVGLPKLMPMRDGARQDGVLRGLDDERARRLGGSPRSTCAVGGYARRRTDVGRSMFLFADALRLCRRSPRRRDGGRQ